MLATGYLCNAYDCYEYKRDFDQYFVSRNWSPLRHRVLILRSQPPSIAVSSMFSLDDVDAPRVPRVALSVFPADGDVVVAFSAIPRDAPFVYSYLERVLQAESYLQKYLLSKLVLRNCENFAIQPEYYDALSDERKDAIGRFFTQTIVENHEDYEDERLYLF